MPAEQPSTTIYRRRAMELRTLADRLVLPEARLEMLAAAAKWERLAELVEASHTPPERQS